MHVDGGWLEEGITLGQSAVSDESSVRSQSDEQMHQGDKVHRTVRRLLFVTRAARRAQDLPQSLAMGIFASSDRTRCLMCQVPTDHEAQARRSGNSCGNECRTHSRELRRLSLSFGGSAPPEAEADTARPRQDATGTAAGTIVSVLRLITSLG